MRLPKRKSPELSTPTTEGLKSLSARIDDIDEELQSLANRGQLLVELRKTDRISGGTYGIEMDAISMREDTLRKQKRELLASIGKTCSNLALIALRSPDQKN